MKRSEAAEEKGEPRKGHAREEKVEHKTVKKGAPFYAAKGSDPNAPMKGDNPQQVPYSTAPGTKPRKPRPVATGGAYKLPRQKRFR